MSARTWALALLLAAAPAARGAAQSGSNTIGATAFMVGTPLAIAGQGDLDFGFVLLGVPKTVLPTAPTAGKWIVTGEKNARVLISFTLPAALAHLSLGGVTLPVSFPAGSARWRRRTDDPAGATAFDPAAGATGMLGPPVEPLLYIWLGGTVTPAAFQPGGSYSSVVVATVAYTN